MKPGPTRFVQGPYSIRIDEHFLTLHHLIVSSSDLVCFLMGYSLSCWLVQRVLHFKVLCSLVVFIPHRNSDRESSLYILYFAFRTVKLAHHRSYFISHPARKQEGLTHCSHGLVFILILIHYPPGLWIFSSLFIYYYNLPAPPLHVLALIHEQCTFVYAFLSSCT